MVPTSSAFAEPSGITSDAEDFYLHLHLPPELDLPLPATTQIYHQPPRSYLIPRWDLGPDSGAFTRIEFPKSGSRTGVQEDVDTFETILAQCTAFLERAPPPQPRATKTAIAKEKEASGERLPAYNPAEYQPGEAYAQGSHSSHTGGRIVLVDEEDGSVIGELSDQYQVLEDSKVRPGSKGSPILLNISISMLTASQSLLRLLSLPMVLRTSASSQLPMATWRWSTIPPTRNQPSSRLPRKLRDLSSQHPT